MDIEQLAAAAHPDRLGEYISTLPAMDMEMGNGVVDTVREEQYKGHHVVIHTTYRITVDGQPFKGHLMLDNDGRLQCHGLPNYSFSSAVNLMEQLIDTFPDDFAGSPMDMGDGQADGGMKPGMHM